MGKYELVGVDRESGMDTELVVEAMNPENARAKGELAGILVTSVTEKLSSGEALLCELHQLPTPISRPPVSPPAVPNAKEARHPFIRPSILVLAIVAGLAIWWIASIPSPHEQAQSQAERQKRIGELIDQQVIQQAATLDASVTTNGLSLLIKNNHQVPMQHLYIYVNPEIRSVSAGAFKFSSTTDEIPPGEEVEVPLVLCVNDGGERFDPNRRAPKRVTVRCQVGSITRAGSYTWN